MLTSTGIDQTEQTSRPNITADLRVFDSESTQICVSWMRLEPRGPFKRPRRRSDSSFTSQRANKAEQSSCQQDEADEWLVSSFSPLPSPFLTLMVCICLSQPLQHFSPYHVLKQTGFKLNPEFISAGLSVWLTRRDMNQSDGQKCNLQSRSAFFMAPLTTPTTWTQVQRLPSFTCHTVLNTVFKFG